MTNELKADRIRLKAVTEFKTNFVTNPNFVTETTKTKEITKNEKTEKE